ncbi:MAG: G5 domain-containing protein [Candidatus Saccharimonadales bacterium]
MEEQQIPLYLKQTLRTYLIWAACLLFTILAVFGASRVAAQGPIPEGDQKLITVYDQGEERTFLTNKTTVGDALRAEGMSIEEVDRVEPRSSTKLAASHYQVNIYRARSVVIHDGASKIQVLTAEQSPRRIMETGGLTMYDEDKSSFDLSRNPLADGGAGLQLHVDRATPFMFNLYGKTFEARTQTTTVGEMLKEKKIQLGPNDGLSTPIETPLVAGMNVSVWRNGKQTVTQEVAITKPVEEIKDMDRELGFREVRTPGSDGARQVTYEIEIRNGQEVARKEIASVTTKEPVKEVIAIGSKPKTYSGSHAEWMAAAGISPNDFSYAETLIQKESGWRPDALNTSSGACGLVQALPCSKLGPNWNDPVVALRWGNSYVAGRYGGWAGAMAHSQSHGWY